MNLQIQHLGWKNKKQKQNKTKNKQTWNLALMAGLRMKTNMIPNLKV